jgi:GNAT superfamily N-acetyltransferase
MSRIQGPFSLSINHEAGLLVWGFDQPHYVRTNYAPPFYSGQLERLGFGKDIDLLAFACRPAGSDYPERVRALLARSPEGGSLRTTGLSHRDWQAGSQRVNALYNDAWAENWGAVPVSEAEATFIAQLSRAVVKPSWIRIAERGGEPVALVGHLPDMNEFAPRDGELFPFGWARLLGGIHLRGTRRSRIAMIGVARRFRGTRVGSLAIGLLMAEAIERARRARIEETEISWMLETNKPVLNLVASLPARHTRTFRIFSRAL